MIRLALFILSILSAILLPAQKATHKNKNIVAVAPFTATGPLPYQTHLLAAKKSGIGPVENVKHLNSLVSKNRLTAVKAKGKGYTIHKLTHSKPYLTPNAKRVMDDIAQQFYAKTKKTITITSLTRTIYDQNRLTNVNANATTGLSAHNYGVAFDISYIRFSKVKTPNARLEKQLEQLLIRFQQQGKIYYIKEKREMCFHVTVR
ncbi:MAG: DUF5715 family protein [Niabella sp.]